MTSLRSVETLEDQLRKVSALVASEQTVASETEVASSDSDEIKKDCATSGLAGAWTPHRSAVVRTLRIRRSLDTADVDTADGGLDTADRSTSCVLGGHGSVRTSTNIDHYDERRSGDLS